VILRCEYASTTPTLRVARRGHGCHGMCEALRAGGGAASVARVSVCEKLAPPLAPPVCSSTTAKARHMTLQLVTRVDVGRGIGEGAAMGGRLPRLVLIILQNILQSVASLHSVLPPPPPTFPQHIYKPVLTISLSPNLN
jgi:hypothetical protein